MTKWNLSELLGRPIPEEGPIEVMAVERRLLSSYAYGRGTRGEVARAWGMLVSSIDGRPVILCAQEPRSDQT